MPGNTMPTHETHHERVASPRPARSRAKSLSVGDLRMHNRDAFVPDMPAFEEAPVKAEGRLILIANRLPVTVTRAEDGTFCFKTSSGGLASGLAGVLRKTDVLWYGWPGVEIAAGDKDTITRRCRDEHRCIPIFLPEDVSERHYNGFSNSILWPLFHYHPEGVAFQESSWDGYCEANRAFAKAVVPSLEDNDIIWVQDYHLMLLPEMIREGISARDPMPKNVKVGFFLHTPFPSSEIFRILPVRENILRGVLHCDLVTFHTPDYARHFINSCGRVLGLATTPSGVQFQNRFVEVKDCPIGIDPDTFYEKLSEPNVVNRIGELKRRFEGVKVIVGVDRLDYIKGVQQKLHALEVFLTNHPEWVGKVVLLQLAVPTRGDVEEYQNLRAVINELVGRINGKFGTVEHTPIHFMHRSVCNNELIALYAMSDICLVTSTRDGMNLVSYEFVACQRDHHGILILSEFAGAAQTLKGCIIVNPWDTDMVASALNQAMTMSDKQRHENYAKMARVVNKKTSENWGTTFVYDIVRISQHKTIKLRVRGPTSELVAGKVLETEAFDSKVVSDGSTIFEEEDSDRDTESDDEDDEGLMLNAASKVTSAAGSTKGSNGF